MWLTVSVSDPSELGEGEGRSLFPLGACLPACLPVAGLLPGRAPPVPGGVRSTARLAAGLPVPALISGVAVVTPPAGVIASAAGPVVVTEFPALPALAGGRDPWADGNEEVSAVYLGGQGLSLEPDPDKGVGCPWL